MFPFRDHYEIGRFRSAPCPSRYVPCWLAKTDTKQTSLRTSNACYADKQLRSAPVTFDGSTPWPAIEATGSGRGGKNKEKATPAPLARPRCNARADAKQTEEDDGPTMTPLAQPSRGRPLSRSRYTIANALLFQSITSSNHSLLHGKCSSDSLFC